MTQRDGQRSAVYAAEQVVHGLLDRAATAPTLDIAGSRITLPPERRFADLRSVQDYVELVLDLDRVRRRWPGAGPVLVRERAGDRQAHYERETATIAVPGVVRGSRWALRELVLLHELAHHVTWTTGLAPHGPHFVGGYLELVDVAIGPEASFVLRVTMAEAGVRSA